MQKATQQLRPTKGPQKGYGTVKEVSTSRKPTTVTEQHERQTHPQKSLNEATDKESCMKRYKEVSLRRFDKKSDVGSLWHSSKKSIVSSSLEKTMKQARRAQTPNEETSLGQNGTRKPNDKRMGKQRQTASLKSVTQTAKAMCKKADWKPEQLNRSDKYLISGTSISSQIKNVEVYWRLKDG